MIPRKYVIGISVAVFVVGLIVFVDNLRIALITVVTAFLLLSEAMAILLQIEAWANPAPQRHTRRTLRLGSCYLAMVIAPCISIAAFILRAETGNSAGTYLITLGMFILVCEVLLLLPSRNDA